MLTYEGFSHKVRDLIEHKQLDLDQVKLLKIGRHFRLSDKAKLIVGRSQEENKRLSETTSKGAIFIRAKDFPGPTALLLNGGSAGCLEAAAQNY